MSSRRALRRAGRVSPRAGSRRGRRLSPRAGSSIAPTDPGLTLLQSATLWLSAANPGSDPQKLQNLGTGGSALDARFGSTTGTDTNDPLLLTHTGTNYLYLPGPTGNYASTPDSAALDISGDIEVLVRVQIGSITGNQAILSKWLSTGNQWSYELRMQGTDLFFYGSGNGVSTSVSTCSGAHGLSIGDTVWLRFTRVNSTGVNTLYKAADSPVVPSSWTQIGTQTVGAGTSFFNSSASLWLGAATATADMPFTGSIYRAIIRSTIGGSAVFDADFTANTNQSSFTESSSNAATVTINRRASGRKSVMVVRPTLLFGTDDYLEVADNDLLDFGASDSFTAIVVQRAWNTIPAVASWVAKRTTSGASGVGWGFYSNGATLDVLALLADGTTASTDVTGATWSAGDRKIIGMIRDVAADEVQSVLNSTISAGTTDGTTGTLNGAVVFRVGRDTAAASPGAYLDGEIEHVVLFRSALTSTELGQIATYLGVS